MRRLGALLVTCLLVVAPATAATQLERISAQVVGVTDADTIRVRMPDGSAEQVRLVGIDSPETRHPSKPVQCFGREASARTSELAMGKTAELELDVEHRDRYGRLLAYVWIDQQMLNLQLAAEGYAVQATYPPNVRYVEEFRMAIASARDQGLGLWSACQEAELAPKSSRLSRRLGVNRVRAYSRVPSSAIRATRRSASRPHRLT